MEAWLATSKEVKDSSMVILFLPISLLLPWKLSQGSCKGRLEPTQFKFHPYSKALKITHLSFVDDLLIFTTANLPTINLVKEGLEEFKVASGLDINPSKSEVFFSAGPQDVKGQILDVLQFKKDTLLVKYLELPLIFGRLRLKDCQPLIDKIQGKIKSWLSRKLSFASRLQLLQSVLYSIQRFWSSNFILPKKVIKTLEQNFNHFLWQG